MNAEQDKGGSKHCWSCKVKFYVGGDRDGFADVGQEMLTMASSKQFPSLTGGFPLC